MERNSVISQIPAYIKNCLTSNTAKYVGEIHNYDPKMLCCGINHWVNYNKLKSLNITSLRNLVSNPTIDNMENELNYFVHVRQTTKNVKIRDFQYKLLHGITSTRYKLFKFKYVPDGWCISCAETGLMVKDDISHSFYNCPMATQTWIEFEKVCKNEYNVEISLNLENCTKSFHTNNTILDETSIHIKKLSHCPMSSRKIISNVQIINIIESVKRIKKCLRQNLK